MKNIHPMLFVLLVSGTAGCHPRMGAEGCAMHGPERLLPEQVRQVRLGMSRDALEQLLGPADYSPAEGLLYFSTGGDCPVAEGSERQASCGLVAEFRDHRADGEAVVGASLRSCWWGAIGE